MAPTRVPLRARPARLARHRPREAPPRRARRREGWLARVYDTDERRHLWAAGLSAALAGCFEVPAVPAAPDDPAPFEVLGVVVTDALGAHWPTEACPEWPTVVVSLSAPLAPDGELPRLFHGELDEDLEEDLAALPLRASTRAREVPSIVEPDGARVSLRPLARLDRGGPYVLGIPRSARSGTGEELARPALVPLRVAVFGGGARARESWPAAGAAGVPPNTRRFAIWFDGEVPDARSAVALVGPSGSAEPASSVERECVDIGWGPGTCVELAPLGAIADGPSALVVLDGAVDRTGARIGPARFEFDVGGRDDTAPPTVREITCAPDETTQEGLCVRADDRSVVVTGAFSEPCAVTLDDGRARATRLAPRGEATFVVDLGGPTVERRVTLTLVDAAGLASELALELATTEELPAVAIAEVRPDPLGREPAQEYVELVNYGAVTIPLDGFSLADDPLDEGDPLPPGLVLPPRGRILVVGDAYDPRDPADARPPPGAAIARLASSLGDAGLAASGEPLILRDGANRRVSAAPALASSAGSCLLREGADGRSGAPGDFAAGAECTPGTATDAW